MIYFLREHDGNNGGEVKIGWTRSPSSDPRRLTLQTGNPRDLVLMGTVPGTKAEGKRLHEQFSRFRIRPKGEWFRAEPELLDAIRSMLLMKGSPASVKDELGRRSGCRYGLKGVTVAVRGQGADLYRVEHTGWDASRHLRLTIFPDPGPEPIDGFEQLRRHHEAGGELPPNTSVIDGLVFACAAYLPRTIWPPGTLFDVPAEDCILMSDWPVVCDCWIATVEEAG